MHTAYPVALALHALAAVIWVGGMFFAYVCLRPASGRTLDPPQRLPLWSATLSRFLGWVWAAVLVLPVTGYGLMLGLYGGVFEAPARVQIMHGLAWVMIALFGYLYFGPFRDLGRAVAAADWPRGGAAIAVIRRIVGTNLVIGLVVIAVATGGRYWG